MSDSQLKQRMIVRRIVLIALVLLLAAGGLFYWRSTSDMTWKNYVSNKKQEASTQNQVNSLSVANASLLQEIEADGKSLVSFTEDKNKYINLASEISSDLGVRINKLVVSDVWQEGEMSGMTTAIEVQGDLSKVCEFIRKYCDVHYVNRINVISCRPDGHYPWFSRDVDGSKVISWFDISDQQSLYEQQQQELERETAELAAAAGIEVSVESELERLAKMVPQYDADSGKFIDRRTGKTISDEDLSRLPITLNTMFMRKPIKAYLVIDFLGRA